LWRARQRRGGQPSGRRARREVRRRGRRLALVHKATPAGGGGAGGGSGGSGQGDSGAVEQEKGHFLNVQFTDKAGKPITGVSYSVKSPDNKVVSGTLAGQIKKGGVPEGNYEVILKAITKAEWSPKKARDGEKVKMLVETAGFEPSAKATFEVWQRDYNRADRKIQTINDIPLDGEKAEAEWTYSYQSGPEPAPNDPVAFKYSSPLFYFIVRIENVQGRSGFLEYKDWIEIELRDEDGNVVANQEYILYLPDGTVRNGKLDQNGYKKETKIPPGYCRVTFPGLS
jgi:hypothetical protein